MEFLWMFFQVLKYNDTKLPARNAFSVWYA